MYYEEPGFSIPDDIIFDIKFLKREDFLPLIFNDKEYIVVAEDDVGNLVGVNADSNVYFLDTCSKTEMYAAKDLPTYIAQLKLCRKWHRPEDLNDDELQANTRQFAQKIKDFDNDAFTDKESYWSLIVEQMEDGLL